VFVVDPRYWNVFHDGVIVSISGGIPGDLAFTIDCEHLYEEVSDGDGAFQLTVTGCDLFQFKFFMDDVTRDEIEVLSSAGMTIVGAEFENGIASVFMDGGLMMLRYRGQSVAMDIGRAVSLQDLCDAADRAVHSMERDL
jgi:hypothetical protein